MVAKMFLKFLFVFSWFLFLHPYTVLAQNNMPVQVEDSESESLEIETGTLDFSSVEKDLRSNISNELFNAASLLEKSLFGQAKAYFDQGNYELARLSFESFLLNHPASLLLPDVMILLSEAYAERGQMTRAVELLEMFLDQFPEESRKRGVQLRLSAHYFKLGDLKKVFTLWDGISNEAVSKVIVYDKLIKAYVDNSSYLDALHIMMHKKVMISDPSIRAMVHQEIIGLIRGRLEEEALRSLESEFGTSFPADEAIIRLIGFYDAKGDYYREGLEVKRFISQFPTHHFVAQARQLLSQIEDKIRVNRYLIAVILPLSGSLASFGNHALHGAELAVQLFKEEFPGASVGLVVRDLESDPSRLRQTLEGWFSTYHPIAVVGPLLSKEVNRIAPMTQAADLVLITPGATARRLFSLGKSVVRNSITNRFLCNAVAEYAVLQLEVERFAVLFPDDQLGHRWVDCFSGGVEKLGGEVVLTEGYSLNDTDFSRTILRLKKTDLEQDGFIDEVEDDTGEVEELYTPGFGAIFLPADAVRAGLIIPQLLFHGFGEVKILGTNSWNSPEFLKLVGPYADEVVLVDGFFKESLDPVVQRFVQQYRSRFKQEPDLFSAQAYDATRVILAALKEGALTPRTVKTAVSETIDFPGASGFIYEILDGEMIKEPFYIRVEDGKFVQMN